MIEFNYMDAAGFRHHYRTGLDRFVEHRDPSARDASHYVLAGDMLRVDDVEANPQLKPIEPDGEFRTLPLESLVQMKLNSFWRTDQVQLRAMMSPERVDQSWLSRFPDVLRSRLRQLLDIPDG